MTTLALGQGALPVMPTLSAFSGWPRSALLVSLAIHAAPLLLLPGIVRQAQAPDPSPLPPLTATLRMLPAARPDPLPVASLPADRVPQAVQAAPVAPRPAPARPAARQPEPERKAPPLLSAPRTETASLREVAPPPAAVVPAIVAAAPPQPSFPATPPSPAVAAPGSDAAALAAPSPAAPSARDSLALDDYGKAISDLLARQQQYPRLAALRGWEGEVRLRLRVARKGSLVAVQVVRSSGHEVLDQHALQLIQGAPLPTPPDNLGDREIQVVVPIHYRLHKPT